MFHVSPGCFRLLPVPPVSDASFLRVCPRSIFYNETTGEPWREGHLVKRPVLADTLQAIAEGGAAALYGGEVGKKLADDIQKNGGIITLQDLADYRSDTLQDLADYRCEARAGSWRAGGRSARGLGNRSVQ